ncbi:DUF2336 domain-containing protein [Rhodovibrio sodomensis]|nr:DUF2336 domain-containing protein [Rhodovibrio sodomensis]
MTDDAPAIFDVLALSEPAETAAERLEAAQGRRAKAHVAQVSQDDILVVARQLDQMFRIEVPRQTYVSELFADETAVEMARVLARSHLPILVQLERMSRDGLGALLSAPLPQAASGLRLATDRRVSMPHQQVLYAGSPPHAHVKVLSRRIERRMPFSLVLHLIQMAANHLRSLLQQRYNMAEEAGLVATASASSIIIEIARQMRLQGEATGGIADSLHAAHLLTSEILLHLLCRSEVDLFDASIACLAGQGVRQVRNPLYGTDRQEQAEILAAAGVPDELHDVFSTALSLAQRGSVGRRASDQRAYMHHFISTIHRQIGDVDDECPQWVSEMLCALNESDEIPLDALRESAQDEAKAEIVPLAPQTGTATPPHIGGAPDRTLQPTDSE